MRYITRSIAIVIFLFFYCNSWGQEVDSAFIKKNLETRSYPIDTDATAVILFEKTTIDVTFERDHYQQKVTTEKTIRILKSSAVNLANVEIFYPDDNYKNYVQNITGTTYNLEGGNVIAAPLPKEDRYKKNIRKDVYEINFTMPSVKEGSIISYSYDVVTQLGSILPIWYVQGQYPKLISEYLTYYPQALEYTAIYHVHDSVTECLSQKEAKSSARPFCHVFKKGVGSYVQSSDFWIARDVTAVHEEPFVTNVQKQYKRVEMQMTGMNTAFGNRHFLNSWATINKALWKDSEYGKLVSAPNSFFDGIIDSISKIDTSEAAVAYNIYSYVRANFERTSSGSFFYEKNLYPVFKNKKGSEAAINTLLISMLTQAGVHAAPLLLSTTANLPTIPEFPVLDRLNYLACIITLRDSTRILLDASDKNNVFSMLPPDCYNGYAWILGPEGSGITLTNDMITDKTTFGIRIYDVSDTGSKIEFVEKVGKIKSSEIRKRFARDEKSLQQTIDDYTRQFSSNISVLENKLENEKDPDANLILKVTGTIKFNKSADLDFIPVCLLKILKENSFKSTVRKLPIEFPYRSELKYSMNITLPTGIEPDSLSKPATLDYEHGSIVYEKTLNYNEPLHILTANIKYDLNNTLYTNDYYKSLRDFYEAMIEQNNEIITLKKH